MGIEPKASKMRAEGASLTLQLRGNSSLKMDQVNALRPLTMGQVLEPEHMQLCVLAFLSMSTRSGLI